MKKFGFLIAVCMMLAALCLSAFAADRVINVYNWGEYISDGSEDSLDVNRAFEEYYKETFGETVRVVYTTYASNEDMYAKLKSGATGYDVIIPSDYMIARLIDEDMLEPLNFDNIPNYEYITEDYRGLYYDIENRYSIPYCYGMVGVLYNSTVVAEEDVKDRSWDLMWNAKYAGKILQFNNSRDGFGTALYRAGADVNSTDPAVWEKALADLKAQKPLLQGYVMDEIFNKMESGEAAVSAYYAGDFLTMYDNNEDLGFYYPVNADGQIVTNLFVDAFCIPKGAKNKDLAECYINFMLSEEPAIANAEFVCYACPNALVLESEDYREDMGEYAMEVLYPEDFSFSENYNAMSYHNLNPETLKLVNDLWEDLKISGDESGAGGANYLSTALVAALVIVAALAAWLIISKIQKSKREKMY
ncbi:MAG: ABC transporter substrate-binding protein [Clostridia bacterium]|nr:ABC transporter substrate-binding protein [Clostridia bacterium]